MDPTALVLSLCSSSSSAGCLLACRLERISDVEFGNPFMSL